MLDRRELHLRQRQTLFFNCHAFHSVLKQQLLGRMVAEKQRLAGVGDLHLVRGGVLFEDAQALMHPVQQFQILRISELELGVQLHDVNNCGGATSLAAPTLWVHLWAVIGPFLCTRARCSADCWAVRLRRLMQRAPR